jgi:hypothetical protein
MVTLLYTQLSTGICVTCPATEADFRPPQGPTFFIDTHLHAAYTCHRKISAVGEKSMNSILITPKNPKEFRLLNEMLVKMNFYFKTLTDEEKEDVCLAELMKKADRSKKIKRETIMKKLAGAK